MEKTQFIKTVLEHGGIDCNTITNRTIYYLIFSHENGFYNPVRTYDKKLIIKTLLETMPSSHTTVSWYTDMVKVFEKIEEDADPFASMWKVTQTSGGMVYKYCPNCGCKMLSDGCGCGKQHSNDWMNKYFTEEPLPETCSNKYCNCNTPKLITRIHCEKNRIRFTHSNDLDTLTTMEHREVEQFTDSSNRDGKFLKKLRCMNLADKLTLYNCELPYLDESYDKDDMKGVMIFGCFLNALSVLGYTINKKHGYSKGWGDFHIVDLKKEDKC